jgi:hypothetical protein
VPEAQVEHIRAAELAGAFDRTKREKRNGSDGLVAGTRLRITAGPLSGAIAEIAAASATRRVELLLGMICRGTARVKIDKASIERT